MAQDTSDGNTDVRRGRCPERAAAWAREVVATVELCPWTSCSSVSASWPRRRSCWGGAGCSWSRVGRVSGRRRDQAGRQDDATTGWRRLLVQGWAIQPFAGNTSYGWLHDPSGRGTGIIVQEPGSRSDPENPTTVVPRPDTPNPPPATQRPPKPGSN